MTINIYMNPSITSVAHTEAANFEEQFLNFLYSIFNGGASEYSSEEMVSLFKEFQTQYPAGTTVPQTIIDMMDDNGIKIADNTFALPQVLVTYITAKLYAETVINGSGTWDDVVTQLRSLFDTLGTTSQIPFIQSMINTAKAFEVAASGKKDFLYILETLGVVDANFNFPADAELATYFIDNMMDNFMQNSNFQSWYKTVGWISYMKELFLSYGYDSDGKRIAGSDVEGLYMRMMMILQLQGDRLTMQIGNSQKTYEEETEASENLTAALAYFNSTKANYDVTKLVPVLKTLAYLQGGMDGTLNARFSSLYNTITKTLEPIFNHQIGGTGDTLMQALSAGDMVKAQNIFNDLTSVDAKTVTDNLTSVLGILGSQSSTLNTELGTKTGILKEIFGALTTMYNNHLETTKSIVANMRA